MNILPWKKLSKTQKLYFQLIIGGILVVLIPLVVASLQTPNKASAAWFDDNFAYRQTVAITNAGTAQADFQVSFVIDTATLITNGKMQSDCDDIRIIDATGKILPHWIEEGNPGCNSSTTKIWTLLSSIPTSPQTLYIYYGNPSAFNVENPKKVFLFFDTFNGSSIDSNLWSTARSSGTYTINVSGGKVTLSTSTNSANSYIDTNNPVTNGGINFAMETKFNVTGSTGDNIRDRFYLISNPVSGTKPTTSNFDYGIFSQGSGPQPQQYWNGWTSTAVTTAHEIKMIQSLDGTNFNLSLTDLSDQSSIYSNSVAQAGLSFNYLKFGATRDAAGTATSKVALDWVFVRKHASTAPSAVNPTTEEQAPSPAAYWSFDDGYGTTAKDSTTNKNNGTLSGTTLPVWQTEDQCIFGKCLYFDGSTSYVQVSDNSSLNSTAAITISMWVKMNNPTTNYVYLLAKGDVSTAAGRAYEVRMNGTTGKPQLVISDGSSAVVEVSANTAIQANIWTHLVFTWNSATATIYINGKIDNSANSTRASINNDSNPLRLGTDINNQSTRTLKGFIDEVKIYPYARTTAQIKSDYASRGSVKGVSAQIGSSDQLKLLANGLVGWWRQDEATWSGTLNEVVDASGNGNHGQAQGTTGGKAYPTNGKFGKGGFFDGVDDSVTIGDLSYTKTPPFTVSTWFKSTDVTKTQGVINKYASGSWNGFQIFIQSSTVCSWFLRDNSNYTAIAQQGGVGSNACYSIQNNTWYHAVVTVTSSGMTMYINGQLWKTVGWTGNSGSTTETTNLQFGTYTGNTYLTGTIDDTRIYNRALSAAETAQLYNTDFSPGPVGYWNFEDGSGSTVTDKGATASASMNNGTWNGTGSRWIAGKYGKGGSFSSSKSDYVNIPDNDLLDPGKGNFTVSVWVKTTDSGTQRSIVNKYDSGGGEQGWSIALNTNGTLKLQTGDSTGHNTWSDTTVINNGAWTHVTMVVDHANTTATLYINGVQRTLSGGGTLKSGNYSVTKALQIGYYSVNPGYLGTYFNGQIDEVKYYNYARTQKQVISDMNAGHPNVGSPVGSALVHLNFDGGFGNVASNSGNLGSAGNAGLYNFANPATTASGWSQDGKFGKALQFDGVNDYGLITDNAAFTITSGYTASAWIKISALSAISNIIGQWGNGGSGNAGWRLALSSNRYLQIDNHDGSTTSTLTDTTTLLSTNTWYHVVAVYDGGTSGTNAHLYVNGVKVKEGTLNSAPQNSSYWVGIGAVQVMGSNQYFNGSIDEVKVYNYALTADEVKVDMNRGSALVLGSMSDTSGLAGGSVASNSASAAYCIPGDTAACTPPVAEWNFSERYGNTVSDTSGNNNNGTWSGTGGTHWTTGKEGPGGKFNGSDDYVTMGTPAILNDLPNSDFTVSAWIYDTQTANSKWGSIMAPYTNPTGWLFRTISNASGSRSLSFQVTYNGGTAANYRSTDGTIAKNTWYHVTAVWHSSTKTATLYINGAIPSYQTQTTGSGTYGTDATLAKVIGTYTNDPSNDQQFKGRIDQVRVFNYARTAAQIAWDYNRGGPVGHWALDECQGDTVYDSSGNGNNGTITIGGSGEDTLGTCATSSTAWGSGATGKRNYSLDFDGTDDYVEAPHSSSNDLKNATGITLSGWIKSNSSTSQGILGKWDGSVGGGRQYNFGVTLVNSNMYAAMGVSGSGTNRATRRGDTVLATGQWYHIVAIWKNDATMQIYVNGIAQTLTDVSSSESIPTALNGSSSRNLCIGTTNNANSNTCATNTQPTNGQIDDVQIFNYALTKTQIKLLFNNGAVNFSPSSGAP